MITISEATSNDFKTIQEIAYQTWPLTYGEILSKTQLDYMLAAFYSEEALNDNVTKKELEFFKDVNNTAMFRGGAAFADAVTFGAEKIEKKLVEEFSKVKGKKTLPFNAESDLTDYLQLYADLAK